MKITILVVSFFLLLSPEGKTQSNYFLDLNSEILAIEEPVFFIFEIADERTDKSDAGHVLSGSKTIKAKFKSSLAEDLKIFYRSIPDDSTKTPVVFAFEKFSLTETGTISNHKIVFEYSIKFYRLYKGKRYLIYEVNGKPSMTLKGSYPHPQEKLVRQVLKSAAEDFSTWISGNTELYILANNVKVVFEDSVSISGNLGGDSIVWNADYKLNWKDFKSPPTNSEFIAESNCVFYYAANALSKNGVLELHINLFAGFDRNSSWVKLAKADNALLAHEQLHFDICALQIRFLRNKILNTELDLVEFDSQIHALIDQAHKEYENLQQKYDLETLHGINAQKQLSWQNDIRNQLKNTTINGSIIE